MIRLCTRLPQVRSGGTHTSLLLPRYVALDSSHLARLADDWSARNNTRRGRACAFQAAFDEQGYVLLLSWHHLQELLSHGNADRVSARMTFIRSLPMIGLVRPYVDEGLPGSVIHLQAREVKAAFDDSQADLTRVRDLASANMIRLESGEAALRPMVEAWPVLKQEFQRQAQRAREVVAISRSGFTGMGNVRVCDMLNGTIRTPDDIRHRMEQLYDHLSRDIRTRGDKRLKNPDQAAASFMMEIRRMGSNPVDARRFGLAVLKTHGVDEAEIGDDTTFDDVGRIAKFRKRLELVNRSLGLPWLELKATVTMNRVPSALIEAAREQFRPDTARWEGGDLNDNHLACLAAYADITYVDKRTYEALAIGRRKFPALASILRRIEKMGDYSAIAEQLA